eukprot:m.91120 g.91120  ORF g.91120 m.91120 type:complete len:140 (-) comp12322_c0_seq26:208-627(-)
MFNVVFCLCYFRSSLSVFCVVAFVFIMIGIAATDEEKVNPIDEDAKIDEFIGSQNIFRAFSLLAFAFTCHTTMFPIYLSLKQRTVPRMMKAIHSAMIVCFLLYVCVGLCGYFDYSVVSGVSLVLCSICLCIFACLCGVH